MPSIKYNIKLVAAAYNIIPAGFEHYSCGVQGHLSFVILKYLCEILYK